MPELTDTLVGLTHDPDLFTLESVHVYIKDAARVNGARDDLFTTGSRCLEINPQTRATLYQHVKRAPLQANFYWSQATGDEQEIPNFSEWGWTKDSTNIAQIRHNHYGTLSVMFQLLDVPF